MMKGEIRCPFHNINKYTLGKASNYKNTLREHGGNIAEI